VFCQTISGFKLTKISGYICSNEGTPQYKLTRKGRPPFKRLKSASEMPRSRKKAVHAKHTSSTNNVSEQNTTTTVSTINYETKMVRVTYKFMHLNKSGVVFCVTSIKQFMLYFVDMVFTGVYYSIL